jgi:ubiquinone/menaquinone biosynthesis C-methylase UbiE
MRLTTFLQKLKPFRPPNEKGRATAVGPNHEVAVANLRPSYEETMARFLARTDRATAMSMIVGGQYEEMGKKLCLLVEHFGLRDGDYLIDVGCGSGRLAWALSRSHFGDTIRYLGLDIVPAMLEYAVEKCQRPLWRFELVRNLKIPEADDSADMVFFASVFTHLLQEESFLYLREAQRVLKTGGKIVASYLDINSPKHWEIFETNVNSTAARQSVPMNIFLSEDFFKLWAAKLGLEILQDKPPDGGQRVCILQKR